MNPVILILIFPFIEIVALIEVGRRLGVWPTVFLVLAGSIIGGLMLRRQGMTIIDRVREAAGRGESPTRATLDALWISVAGLLLIVPGFVSDVLALALLVPPLRRALGAALFRGFFRGTVHVREAGFRPSSDEGEVIDVDFAPVPDEPPPRASLPAVPPPSGPPAPRS